MSNTATAVRFHDQQPPVAFKSLRDELLRGLRSAPKMASPLFYTIGVVRSCSTRSAYSLSIIPHAEEAILRDAADDIANVVGRDATLIELGSGASRKVRLLLEAVRPMSYLGIDIPP